MESRSPSISSLAAHAAFNPYHQDSLNSGSDVSRSSKTTYAQEVLSTQPRSGSFAPSNGNHPRTRNRYVTHNMNQDDPTQFGSSRVMGGNVVAIEIEPDETSVGQGRVVDPDAMTGERNAWADTSNRAPV